MQYGWSTSPWWSQTRTLAPCSGTQWTPFLTPYILPIGWARQDSGSSSPGTRTLILPSPSGSASGLLSTTSPRYIPR